ncbi:Small GTP-binding protein domain [Trinorchestia longiramus]|nr:Small GTP-binding protein domain [Trinorchestia longiramus]
METINAKIVVVGSQGVGKTSLVTRYSDHTFTKHTSATVGAAYSNVTTVVHDYKVNMQVWDTAGQERYRALTPLYYRNANAAFLVFDITDMDSFIDAQHWADELHRNVLAKLVIVVLGNKVDLEEQDERGELRTSSPRRVSRAVALEFAERIGGVYFEASALTNDGAEIIKCIQFSKTESHLGVVSGCKVSCWAGVDAAFNHVALILAKRATEAAKNQVPSTTRRVVGVQLREIQTLNDYHQDSGALHGVLQQVMLK